MLFVNSKNWFQFCHFNCTAVFVQQIFLCVVFKCNYWFNFRLEFMNVVLREILGGWDGEVNRMVERIVMGFRGMRFVVLSEILGGEMEKLTGGWRELWRALGEWDLWCWEDIGGEMEKLTGGWRELWLALGEWDLWCWVDIGGEMEKLTGGWRKL